MTQLVPTPTPVARTADLWWKNAVFYCLHVAKFRDGNGDGVGDFVGLTEKVDYLAGLGVDCVWLMPYYTSPMRDDGYDVADYYSVDPRYGTLGDFVDFVRAARDRGLRVIADFVANHTSDEHPWFRAGRDRSSPFHEFYVWADEKPEEKPEDLVFPDEETSIWEWDERAGRFYHHKFYSFQPDLNVANPVVRDEIRKIASFWLQLGLSGFRVDAVPYLVEMEAGGDPDGAGIDWLRELSGYLSRRDGTSVLAGEVNVEPKQLRDYFGGDKGDALHMAFNFVLNQALYLALVRGESAPLDAALDELPDIPERSQWANFVRNHDELTLDKLSEAERQEVFEALAPDEGMRLYGRGIRRRLPAMLGRDRARMELAYSLLFTLPGSPALLWGEEVGLEEDLSREDRLAVRVPMDWEAAAEQRHDPESLLNWMERIIRLRKECPEVGWGKPTRLQTGEGCVFAHRFDWHGRTLLFAHNLSGERQAVELEEGVEDIEGLEELLTGERVGRDGRLRLELDPSGYLWFRARTRR